MYKLINQKRNIKHKHYREPKTKVEEHWQNHKNRKHKQRTKNTGQRTLTKSQKQRTKKREKSRLQRTEKKPSTASKSSIWNLKEYTTKIINCKLLGWSLDRVLSPLNSLFILSAPSNGRVMISLQVWISDSQNMKKSMLCLIISNLIIGGNITNF